MKKENIIKLIPSCIMAFVAAFMIFIYEPIVVYSSNTEDFWFDFGLLFGNNIVFALISFTAIILISIVVYAISKISKKEKIYDCYLIIASIAFIVTYIQGNYLAGALPALDGSPIEWDKFRIQEIISYVLWIIVAVLNIVMYIKFKKEYKKIISYISLGIFAMLFVSFITILASNPQMYAPKGVYASTYENINKLSKNKNFLILLADMEDSKTFDKVLKESGKTNLLKDFTYYPDTLSAYPFTRESIPYILSGRWYEAEENINDYYNKALNESKLFENLKEKDYDINVYEQDFFWTDEKALELDNIKIVNSEMDKKVFLKQELKYIMFKYLPFNLKKYSKIDTLNYNNCKMESENQKLFKADNKVAYDILGNISLQERNYFQFIHIDGGHFPWDMNENMEKIENGTYEEKIGASIKYIEKYLSRIKESGQYDNTAIIILADHGNNGYDAVGRQNPILYIKGFNENHEYMQISDKKVSYVDLNESIYFDLLDGKKNEEMLNNIEENRIRRFIWYKDYDDMYEQFLDGHAWETEKLITTENRYKR